MLPIPTVAELADFSGRDVSTYTSYARSALLQSTLLMTIRSELDIGSFDGLAPDDQTLLLTGIKAMADYIYLRFPYQQVIASPLMNESVGSYSYAKAQQEMARNAAVMEINAENTGVMFFDLAMQYLSLRQRAGGVFSGGITVFEEGSKIDNAELLIRNIDGRFVIVGPADRDKLTVPFSISSQVFPMDPGGGL